MSTTITNWGTALIASFASVLALVLAFLPGLMGFLVLLLVGWIVGTVIAKAVTFVLRKVEVDRVAARIGFARLERRMNIHIDVARLLGRIVYWFVFLIFLVPAVNALGLTTLSTLLDQISSYLPNVFVAIIVLLLGILLATFVADLIERAMANSRTGNPRVVANIARYGIILFVVLLVLYQLQIAPAMIQTLFTAIVGGVALALALAFGLGGRETAKHYLDHSTATLASVGSLTVNKNMDGSPTISSNMSGSPNISSNMDGSPTVSSSSSPASTTLETDPSLNGMRGRLLRPLPEQKRSPQQNPIRRPVADH